MFTSKEILKYSPFLAAMLNIGVEGVIDEDILKYAKLAENVTKETKVFSKGNGFIYNTKFKSSFHLYSDKEPLGQYRQLLSLNNSLLFGGDRESKHGPEENSGIYYFTNYNRIFTEGDEVNLTLLRVFIKSEIMKYTLGYDMNPSYIVCATEDLREETIDILNNEMNFYKKVSEIEDVIVYKYKMSPNSEKIITIMPKMVVGTASKFYFFKKNSIKFVLDKDTIFKVVKEKVEGDTTLCIRELKYAILPTKDRPTCISHSCIDSIK
jgi:hypothetical protein